MMNDVKVGIVILNYNTWKETVECIDSIKENTKLNYHIYIVDNKSSDSSMEKLGEVYEDSKNVTLIQSGTNAGYSAGNNVGIKVAIKERCDVIYILNSDVELLNDAIGKMTNTLFNNDSVMVVGPSVINNENKESQLVRRKLTWESFFFGRKPFCNIPYLRNKGDRGYHVENVKEFIFDGMVSGCCWGIRSNDIEKLNYLDENVFLYYEEDILAYKIEEEGKKLAVNYEAKIWHKENVSTNKIGRAFVNLHRWTSVLYLLKYYAQIGKMKQLYIVITNIVTWMVLSIFRNDYSSYCKKFINMNIGLLRGTVKKIR